MDNPENWDIAPKFKNKMHALARQLRQRSTTAETLLWRAIRNRQLEGRKFRRQVPVGAYVVDFYCASERLAVELDGPIHEHQLEADRLRQELIESLGIHFVRLNNQEVEEDLPSALEKIQCAFHE